MTPSQGYIDLQVNGYGGIDFNQDDLSAQALHTACQKLRDDGVAGILATLITDTIEVMAGRLRRLVELRAADPLAQQMIRGLHIEGPFLSDKPHYRGAHPAAAIHPARWDLMQRLLDAGGGLTRIVTLAPEQDTQGSSSQVTRRLADQGIIVSAGHTDASLDQLKAAIDNGLSMVTHLGNGCPGQLPRHDNIIQRSLALREHLWLCFIADGIHIPFYALANYLKVAGVEKSIVVTDAMAAAGLGPGRYQLGRWDLVVGEDQAVRSPDGTHLVGSAMPMNQAAQHLSHHLGLTPSQIQSLTRDHAASLLG